MKRGILFSILTFIYCILSNKAMAIEDPLFNVRGDSSIEIILEKIGAPKGSSLPVVFKNKEREIKVEVLDSDERIVSIDFNPPVSFSVNNKDLFEKIEIKDSGDRPNHTLIISDPKSGRIWRLTPDLTVSQLELVTPWVSKSKLSSFSEILAEMKLFKIQKIQKKKVEIKK